MILRRSKWSFQTSNSGALSLGLLGTEGGTITLVDPKGKLVKFAYGAMGASVGRGFALPKLGKVSLPGATGSSESFVSGGVVLLAPSFPGADLAESDICGACTFIELSAGLAWGEAGYAMSFGMNPALVAAFPAVPALATRWLVESVKGYIFFKGTNYGLQAGVSAGAFIGYVRATG